MSPTHYDLVAKATYEALRQRETVALQAQIELGKWLLASLLIIHGGAIVGLFQSKELLSAALASWALWWLVAGIMLTLLAGLTVWANWAMVVAQFEDWADANMLIDPAKWPGKTKYDCGITVAFWGGIIFGVLAAGCIVGAAVSLAFHGYPAV